MKIFVLILLCTGCQQHSEYVYKHLEMDNHPVAFRVNTQHPNMMDNGDHYPIYKSRHDVEH